MNDCSSCNQRAECRWTAPASDASSFGACRDAAAVPGSAALRNCTDPCSFWSTCTACAVGPAYQQLPSSCRTCMATADVPGYGRCDSCEMYMRTKCQWCSATGAEGSSYCGASSEACRAGSSSAFFRLGCGALLSSSSVVEPSSAGTGTAEIIRFSRSLDAGAAAGITLVMVLALLLVPCGLAKLACCRAAWGGRSNSSKVDPTAIRRVVSATTSTDSGSSSSSSGVELSPLPPHAKPPQRRSTAITDSSSSRSGASLPVRPGTRGSGIQPLKSAGTGTSGSSVMASPTGRFSHSFGDSSDDAVTFVARNPLRTSTAPSPAT